MNHKQREWIRSTKTTVTQLNNTMLMMEDDLSWDDHKNYGDTWHGVREALQTAYMRLDALGCLITHHTKKENEEHP